MAEVIFPNTVPPFFPSFVLFARPPTDEQYEHRLAGIRAHNRWLADWCGEYPERRAGIGQIFLNDVDDAIDDVRWIKEHGLRGGILLPTIAPDVTWVKPLYDPDYDRLWAVCEDLGAGEQPRRHRLTGLRALPRVRAAHDHRGAVLLAAPVRAAAAVGRVRALPAAQVRDDRDGLRVGAAAAPQLDGTLANVRNRGAIGELRFAKEHILPKSATEYFHQNCWMGVSQPAQADAAARRDRSRPLHVGQRLSARRRHLPLHA